MHEHVEPVGHARRRAARPQRARPRAAAPAVGQDVAGAGVEGRDRVPEALGPRRAARRARLQPRRLRLHDVHRQLRPAAGRDLGGGERGRPRGRVGAERQPQLRGAHQPRREDELPRVAAARRRLRARRARWTSTSSSDPLGIDADGNDVYLRDLWPSEQEVAETVESAVQSDMFRSSYGEVFEGDERWNSLEVPTGDRFAWPDESTYVRQPPYFEGMPAEPEPLSDIDGRARARQARRQRHDRPHLARGLDQEGRPGGRVPDRARRRAARLQLLRRAARQPRGDDARHVREHPPAQPARAGRPRAA